MLQHTDMVTNLFPLVKGTNDLFETLDHLTQDNIYNLENFKEIFQQNIENLFVHSSMA